MNGTKRETRYQQGILSLIELSREQVPIVVEGAKDIAALRQLGLKGPIFALAGKSVVAFAESLSTFAQLLILFDFDERGEQLTRQLSEQLEGHKVSVLHNIRRSLKRAFCWRVRVIEGIKPLDNL